jgi:uncharacterized protein with NRDE domain
MCLIVLAYRQHPAWRLILAANRDEFYARPTTPMTHWEDAPAVLAGRDLTGGGTWFGITRGGRFAAVTNYRDPADVLEHAQSRGLLVSEFVRHGRAPRDYLQELRLSAHRYNGFSLLLGAGDELYYFCNRENILRALEPGVYGLSNHLLDTPWPKVERAKRGLKRLIDVDAVDTEHLLALLADDTRPDDALLPDTGVGLTWERLLSPVHIRSPAYGTRSSTVLLLAEDGRVSVTERQYPDGRTRSFAWTIQPDDLHTQ